jgi:hypothetical protein
MLQTSNAENMLAEEPDVSLFVRLGNKSEDNPKRIWNKA